MQRYRGLVRTLMCRSKAFAKEDVRMAAYKAPPEDRNKSAALTQRDQRRRGGGGIGGAGGRSCVCATSTSFRSRLVVGLETTE